MVFVIFSRGWGCAAYWCAQLTGVIRYPFISRYFGSLNDNDWYLVKISIHLLPGPLQKRVRNEVDGIVGDKTFPRFNDMFDMPVVRAIAYEVMLAPRHGGWSSSPACQRRRVQWIIPLSDNQRSRKSVVTSFLFTYCSSWHNPLDDS